MATKYILSFFWLSTIAVISSCSSDKNQNKDLTETTTEINTPAKVAIADSADNGMVISDIPFPFEILDNLYTKHIAFNQKIMNNVANTSKYSQYNMKALNLGVYGSDLAYSVTYGQFQQIGIYIKTAKKLAEDLNIPFAFDQDMMEKYTKFKDNKDSLTKVVYDSYNQVDKALKGDERVGMAALVVTGSWLEGLYLSTKTFVDQPKTDDNASLYKTIGNQKQSLIIVVKLLDEYKNDPYFADIIKELKDITSEYSNVTNNNILNEKELIAINSKVEKLRNRIIEGA